MDPVRSSISAGVVATVVLTVFLLGAGVLVGNRTEFVVYSTFTSVCTIGGPPYCEAGSVAAIALTYLVFFVLFAAAWPLLFGGFTWGLPGDSGVTHGVIFGVVLWVGYIVAELGGVLAAGTGILDHPLLFLLVLLSYLVYGFVLGGVYDYLAVHRTFMSPEPT